MKDDGELSSRYILNEDFDYDIDFALKALSYDSIQLPTKNLHLIDTLKALIPSIGTLLADLIPSTGYAVLLPILRTLPAVDRCQIINDSEMGSGC